MFEETITMRATRFDKMMDECYTRATSNAKVRTLHEIMFKLDKLFLARDSRNVNWEAYRYAMDELLEQYHAEEKAALEKLTQVYGGEDG